MLQIAEFSSCSEINGIIFICIYHISFLSSHGNATAAKSLQTLCDPIDCLLPGSSVPGTLQARTLEWVAISFFNSWKWKLKVKLLSLVRLFTVPWTAAYQAPPSMEFSRQVYWSGVPLPSPMEKDREFPKKTYTSVPLITSMPLTVWIIINYRKLLKRWEYKPSYLSPEQPVFQSRSNS